MAGKSTNVARDYQLLYRVPKKALVNFLFQHRHLGKSLDQALALVCNLTCEATISDFANLNHSDIVQVIQSCPSFTPENARNLYNQHLYRGMKTLYLHEMLDPDVEPQDFESIALLNEQVQKVRGELTTRTSNPPDPLFRDLEEIETSVGLMYELSYSYVAVLQVTDPKTEYPRLVEDLRRGFVWVSPEYNWIAICARDQASDRIISKAVARHIGTRIRRIPIPKAVLKRLEPMDNIRRLSLIDHTTNTRRRWTNAQMSHDQRAMDEIQIHNDQDETTACGYNQPLDDGSTFALGYSNSKGRIFFSRDLTVAQMREWGPEKITQLAVTAREILASEPSSILPSLADQALKGIAKAKRPLIISITEAIMECKENNIPEAPLRFNVIEAYPDLRSYVDESFLVDCPYCQELAEIKCAQCETTDFNIKDGAIVCKACGLVIDEEDVHCEHDHQFTADGLADLLVLRPKTNLLDFIERLMQASGQTYNSAKESFQIRGSMLHYSKPGGQFFYTIEDIPDLRALLIDGATVKDLEQIRRKLGAFKEKCESATIEKCAKCVENRQGGPCYLRLYGLFDDSYTPYPHQGNEFGDYSRIVTIDGQQQQLVIAMKDGSPTNKTLTMRDTKTGRDIYTQIRQYIASSSVNILGISIPRRLEAGFIANLRIDAELHRKKILIIDDRALANMIYSVAVRYSIDPDEI